MRPVQCAVTALLHNAYQWHGGRPIFRLHEWREIRSTDISNLGKLADNFYKEDSWDIDLSGPREQRL